MRKNSFPKIINSKSINLIGFLPWCEKKSQKVFKIMNAFICETPVNQ